MALGFEIIVLAVLVGFLLAAFTGCRVVSPDYPTENPMTPPAATLHLDGADALAMVEFCVDLDSEDDRESSSRNIYKLRSDRIANWEVVADSRRIYAKARGLSGKDVLNPDLNGFPPFGSAWTLWRKTNTAKDENPTFALAFRGTVFSYTPSVVEDALATTVAGKHGLKLDSSEYLNLTFATLPRAEVHEGFAYGVFSQLFDKDFGALPRIKAKVPAGSTLIITGHSQGAALATLTHAFFYYGAQERRFGLAEMKLNLRSYVFAQPKPGNLQFMLDFARITQGGANSFTFNNTLDAIPMLPPTHSFLFGAFEDCPPGKTPGFELIRALNNAGNRIQRWKGAWFENKTAKAIRAIQKKEKDSFYATKELEAPKGFVPESAVSQDYLAAGNVIPLVGLYNGALYYGEKADKDDEFIQHHSTTYRRLLEVMFGYEATTEGSPQLANPPAHD